ncbi:unnamed protein product [Schistosoma curassoni]|uniref:Neur_chan_memb domain-containing protein n=1 Tax=Schistosoma curassoni TaxID=6186 RepID=A0A183KUX4_9TREM|nr:unnamed protein product [Schistosoma curassoni]
MGRILFINIDALELVETNDNLEMNLCLHRSAQKSVKISSHVSNSSKQFNNSNIYPHRSLNDLTEIVSSSVSKSSICSCHYFKQISSPLCYLSTNDISNDQNNMHNNILSNTELSNSNYSLPINTYSNDQMIRFDYLNEYPIENINDLNKWNNEHYYPHLNQTPFKFKHNNNNNNNNNNTKIQKCSKSLYWNKFFKKNKQNQILFKSNSKLKNYYPINFNLISINNKQKNYQSLKYIKNDIDYITKAARQLLIELKQREFKQKIIEQWKIVGIVLDRIFFILYFITILLSALLFHPTLIDDYNDD